MSRGNTVSLRTIAIASPILVLAVSSAAQAQTADELVSKNLAACGGAEKLAAINSYVTKGELRFPGDF